MLNTTLRNGLMLLIWLCLIFSVLLKSPSSPRSSATGGQSTPAADRFWCWPTMTSKTMPPTSVIFRCAPAHSMSRSRLLHNGYHAISVQDILDAHYGLKSLPPKAFLLSFDDGYSSFTPASGRCLKLGTSRRCGRRWAAGWTLPLVSPLILAA